MIFFTVLSLLAIISLSQVNHTAIQPTIIKVRQSPEVKTVPSKHSFTKSFQNVGYQISGKVYQTNEGLLDSQVHNTSFYNKSDCCQFYNKQANLEIVNQKMFNNGFNIESSEVSQQTQTLYLLVNDKSFLIDQNSTRTITAYQFSDDGYSQNPRNITIKSLGLNDSEQIDVALLAINKVLVITDGVKFIGINQTDFSKYWQITIDDGNFNKSLNIDYQFASQNSLIQFELDHIDQINKMTKIVVVWNTVIKVYHFSLDLRKATLVNELTPPSGKYYTSAVIDHDFYALIQGQLVAYRVIENSTLSTDYIDLESKDCWGMNKYESTLHIICRQGGVNYVAEFYLDQDFVLAKDALMLNRYYDQIDDVRLIYKFGDDNSPMLFINGDNDLLLTAYAINRQVLIDSEQRQLTSRFKSLGLESIVTIANLSNFTSTFAIGIATEFIVFLKVNDSPSEIQCNFDRKDNKMRWNILVQINTTNCYANGQMEQLQSICQYSIPLTYYVSLFEVDSSKEVTVNIFIYVVLIACGLLLLGCTFHCKTIRSRAMKEIQKKIEALNKKKGTKPI